MSEDYLWDRSGEPPEELAHLELLLGELRWSGKPRESRQSQPLRRRFAQPRWPIAAAATVIVGLGTALYVHRFETTHPLTSWQLSLAGQTPSAVRVGQVIETMGAVGAKMESDAVGEVDIEPHSHLRVLTAHENEQRLLLNYGTIHAFIWAPPTRFVVDTPSAKTVDLGCKYTLNVGADGEGFLTVQMGWVAFQWRNIESFIPAGAACSTRPGHGPDTPHFLDAPIALTNALAVFDFNGSTQALNTVLSAARPRDALTLWHLLQRTQRGEKAEVFDRFAKLVALPSSVTRESVLNGDRKSLDAAWDALQLGDTSWWRVWKRKW